MPRILGIDFGDVRIGIAVSDEQAFLVGETFTVRETNFEKAVTKLCEIITERNIAEIALGFPKNMDGTVGERGEKSRLLASLLKEKTGLPVHLWDERRTSVDAHRILRENGKRTREHKGTVDAVAASLILEGYLGFRRNKQ
ncbi:MAG: Holliday junction resolvase RuvX [Ruminococcaceae bacterium]|nr:Holliday junction resolvase RuvX [Oscillospiraceae bacterium]